MVKTKPNEYMALKSNLTSGAIRSIVWMMWRRHRAELGFIAILMLGFRVCHITGTSVGKGLAGMFGLVLGALWLVHIARLANGDSDWVGEGTYRNGSAFPAFYLTAPLGDRWLTFVPAFFGVISTSILVLLGSIVVWPETDRAKWLPYYGLGIALTISLQALAWTRMTGRYTKILFAGVLLISGCALSFAYAWLHFELSLFVCTYSAIAIVFVTLCSSGFSKSRHGYPKPRMAVWEANLTPARNHGRNWPRFRSGSDVLLWTGWRRQGLALPIVTAFWCLAYLAIQVPHQMALSQARAQFASRPHIHESDVLFRYPLERDWLFDKFTPLIVLVFFSALVVGVLPRKVDVYQADLRLKSFIGTKPISGMDFVLAQLRIALKSALLSTTLVASTILFAFHFWQIPIDFYWFKVDEAAFLSALTWDQPSWVQSNLAWLFWVSFLFFAIFNAQTLMFAAELSGRRLLSYIPLLAPFLLFIGALGASSTDSAAVGRFSVLLWSVVFLNVALGIAAGVKLHSRGLISKTGGAAVVFGWLICLWLFADGYARFFPRTAEGHYGILVGCLLIPMTRFLIAPLMFEWNRHR